MVQRSPYPPVSAGTSWRLGLNPPNVISELCTLVSGKEIVRDLLGLPADSPNLDKVYLAVYKNFVEGLDAIDNGIMQYPGDEPARHISNTGLSSRVGRLNPR